MIMDLGKLFLFHELSAEAQARASWSFIDGDRALVIQRLRQHKISNLRNIHATVNNETHIRALYNSLRSNRLISETNAIRVAVLVENVAMFSAEGDYFLFTRMMFTSQLMEELGLKPTDPQSA